MAENVYDSCRDSTVFYVTPSIQGYMEKKGLMRSKAKVWCSLQGSTLYLQKNPNDVMSTVDLREAHQVRKAAGDTSGAQFEIIMKKKTHAFITPSSDECAAWVKALHNSMKLKDQDQRSSQFFVDTPGSIVGGAPVSQNQKEQSGEGTYSSVSEDTNSKENHAQPKLELSEYADPDDLQKSENKAVKNDENIYNEIGDQQTKSIEPTPTADKPKPSRPAPRPPPFSPPPAPNVPNSLTPTKSSDDETQTYVNSSSLTTSGQSSQVPQIHIDDCSSKTKVPSSDDVGNYEKTYDDGYSKVVKNTTRQTSTGSDNDNVYVDAKEAVSSFMSSKPSPSVPKRNSPLQSVTSIDQTEDEEDPFGTLMEALTDKDPNVPAFVHPLTPADREPVEQLRDFMRNNTDLCRVSYTGARKGEDPLVSFKSFLATLNANSSS